MTRDTFTDRAVGSIVASVVGEALAVPVHWIYDVDELQRRYGWIDSYLPVPDDGFHPGVESGDVSQTGQVFQHLLYSMSETGEYSETAFTTRMDELLATLDGTRFGGRYTQKDMLDVYQKRIVEGREWTGGGCASDLGDTTDAFQRAGLINIRYADDPMRAARIATEHVRLHYADGHVVHQAVAFGALIGELVRGAAFDADIGNRLYARARRGELPYGHALSPEEKRQGKTADDLAALPEPDPLLWPGQIARAATNETVTIEPLWAAAQVYGMPCAFFMVVPSAYYIAARCGTKVKTAIEHAINGGGQNLARASLVGMICGAVGGLGAIPGQWIDGLKHHAEVLDAANRVAGAVDLDGPAFTGEAEQTELGFIS